MNFSFLTRIVSILAIVTLPTVSAQNLPKRLVGYYGSWSKSDTPSYSAARIPYTKLTHVIHAGVNLDDAGDGSIDVPSDFLEAELLTNAHAAGVKVLFYVGASSGSVYSQVAADPTARANLVQNIFSFVTTNGYDGVDIDWEYPNGQPDGTNFVILMGQIRQALPPPTYLTSIDVPNVPVNGYALKDLAAVTSWFNVMMYDCAGPWAGDVQLNSPIFPDPANPNPQGSVYQAIQTFVVTGGVPKSQLNMARRSTDTCIATRLRCGSRASLALICLFRLSHMEPLSNSV